MVTPAMKYIGYAFHYLKSPFLFSRGTIIRVRFVNTLNFHTDLNGWGHGYQLFV